MKPLEGVTVIELSTMITAAFAAMMMAEQGANVIKIEPIDGGDPMRFLGSSKAGISALFANCNRGKKSFRANLKDEAGKQLVRELAGTADVLLCNFRPGVMDSLGLGSDALRSLNHRLIYMAVSGFGTVGPERNTPAYDPVIQAQTGFTAVQGSDGPEFIRTLICDKVTAYTACQAATAALYLREKTGKGQHIDLSMMDAALYFLFPDGFMDHTLLDNDVIHLPPISDLKWLMQTKDGHVTVSASTDHQRISMLMAVDHVHLLADERFNTEEKQAANHDLYIEILTNIFQTYTTDDLIARLREHDVPAARCLSYEEALNHPQFAANETIDTFNHPVLGTMRRVKPPAQFEGKRLPVGSNSPVHGEHTEIVLKEMGKSAKEIAALIDNGVVAGS